jgi:hypothetical protein
LTTALDPKIWRTDLGRKTPILPNYARGPWVLSLEGSILPITLIKTNNFSDVYNALRTVKRKFSAKLLRCLKNHVYDLVKSNDPKSQIHVVDLEKETDASKIEIVYGIGVAAQIGAVGYKPIKVEELLRAVVFDGSPYNAEQIILHTLPDLLTTKGYVPVFKFLRQAGYIGSTGKDPKNLPPKVQARLRITRQSLAAPPKQYKNKRAEVRANAKTIQEVEQKYGPQKGLLFIHFLDNAAITVESLTEFLSKHFEAIWAKKDGNRTYLKKLVCLLDLIKFGPETDGK